MIVCPLVSDGLSLRAELDRSQAERSRIERARQDQAGVAMALIALQADQQRARSVEDTILREAMAFSALIPGPKLSAGSGAAFW